MDYDRMLDTFAAGLGAHWKGIHPQSCPPILAYAASRRYCRTVAYGPQPWRRADIWKHPDAPADAPVLLFVPGGAWLSGRRVGQGYAMFREMIDQGWICVSIDYRSSPRYRWPAHLNDVRAAIRWVRSELRPRFLAVSGASAGGHLASVAALTGEPVDALVSLYGAYNWCVNGPLSWGMVGFVRTVVMRGRRGVRQASPLHLVHRDAPPVLLIHGTRDHITPIAGARAFYHALRAVSRSRVELLEIPGAGHGFDLVRPGQTRTAVRRVVEFLRDEAAPALTATG